MTGKINMKKKIVYTVGMMGVVIFLMSGFNIYLINSPEQIAENKAMLYWPVLIGLLFSLSVVYIITAHLMRLSSSLETFNKGLAREASLIELTSKSMEDASSKLSSGTAQQSSGLQGAVSSIDEISAMVSRNADGAQVSAQKADESTMIAKKGKEKAQLMMDSISAIAKGNDEIVERIKKSNEEISEIVKVIQEIGQKTQVINDIVFQTKLLSFNASVEAARAGEHGKGFAVVAEEVGNLASMSGNAAKEITDMLSKSVEKVTSIVSASKLMMDELVQKSKEKVSSGTLTANECADALDEILHNFSSVNDMVREISKASQEQSVGVREINKAMSEMDELTHSNSIIANESSNSASELRSQAIRLNSLAHDLAKLIGASDSHKNEPPQGQSKKIFKQASNNCSIEKNEDHKKHLKVANTSNVLSLAKPSQIKNMSNYSQNEKNRNKGGIELEVPKSDDPRFEEA